MVNRDFWGPHIYDIIPVRSNYLLWDDPPSTGHVNKQFATQKMAIEIVDLHIETGDFNHSFLYVYQRVTVGK